jgi:hypothetical protein
MSNPQFNHSKFSFHSQSCPCLTGVLNQKHVSKLIRLVPDGFPSFPFVHDQILAYVFRRIQNKVDHHSLLPCGGVGCEDFFETDCLIAECIPENLRKEAIAVRAFEVVYSMMGSFELLRPCTEDRTVAADNFLKGNAALVRRLALWLLSPYERVQYLAFDLWNIDPSVIVNHLNKHCPHKSLTTVSESNISILLDERINWLCSDDCQELPKIIVEVLQNTNIPDSPPSHDRKIGHFTEKENELLCLLRGAIESLRVRYLKTLEVNERP